jgi:GT2 family glycosyltransferase
MSKSTVIIPAFNNAALTAQCLGELIEQKIANIVVVDDCSSDSTPDVLAGFAKKIRVVAHTENLGFAVSCNDGAAITTTEYLVFLNNDTIPSPGWLRALEDCAEKNPKAAVVGSKLLYPDNTIQHAGVVICQDRYPRHIYSGFPADHPAVNKSRQFQIVTGACMLIRRAVFEEAGGFDIAFRNGFEDVDLCLRLSLGGHQIHYCHGSELQHLESVSQGRFKHDGKNVALYRERWIKRVQPDDLRYYVDDQLLRLSYEGHYPIKLEVSTILATLEGNLRSAETEHLLRERSRQVAELCRENVRQRVQLGLYAGNDPQLKYQELRRRIRETVQEVVPPGETILVLSKGDTALVDFPKHRGWHFPQNEQGVYAGHHPLNSAEAIEHLEDLRQRGAHYFLIPKSALWWLDHYIAFGRHLESHYIRVAAPQDICAIYRLVDRCEQAQRERQITAHTQPLALSQGLRNLQRSVA